MSLSMISVAALAWLGSGAARANDAPPPYTLGGYVETYYQHNFNDPANGITNFRGFDNRANSLTLSNVALDAQWDRDGVIGRLALQVGATPATYYAAEPALPGAASNATNPQLWQLIQQAWAGYRVPVGQGLTLSAGLFLSPIGPEGIAVKVNWNLSRSNLFFGLPFYHSGAQASYPLGRWTLSAAVYNGWNSVVDNNEEKSIAAKAAWTSPDKLAVSLLYFGGVERPAGAPEGRPWRHDLDLTALCTLTAKLSLLAHANAGFEDTSFGRSAWAAGALYGRLLVLPTLYVAARGDVFREVVASDETGAASAIFWPVATLSSQTATLGFQPGDHASFRLEYRHDQADGEMFFGGVAPIDDATGADVPNRASQDTLTIGATAWF